MCKKNYLSFQSNQLCMLTPHFKYEIYMRLCFALEQAFIAWLYTKIFKTKTLNSLKLLINLYSFIDSPLSLKSGGQFNYFNFDSNIYGNEHCISVAIKIK